MEDKVKEKMLADLKRSNKTRKLYLAKKYGFESVEEYKAYLEGSSERGITITNESKVKPTIHNVFIMDASGSMSGSKYSNGVEGIKSLIKSIQEDKFSNNTISVIEFSSYKVNTVWLKSPNEVYFYGMGADGGTPLYKTLGNVIHSLLLDTIIKPNDKVLINIVTDGCDTEGWGKYMNLPEVLKTVQKENNYTITFVGTKEDVDRCIRNFYLDDSNTLVHDNTGAGIKMSFEKTISSRTVYSQSASEGKDVSRGFYKTIK